MDDLKEQIQRSAGRGLLKAFLDENFGDNAAEMLKKFDRLTEMYFEVMAVTNISALKTPDDVYIKHYLDSIFPYKYFAGDVCDVGCGGGFPCIPLAIVTGLNITGVESVGKKLLLIHRSVPELSLKTLKCEYSRSEDLVKTHKSYDTVCARAVADVDRSIELCAPLVKQYGKLLLYRTQNDSAAKKQTEIKYKVALSDTVDYCLPGTDIRRRLFIYSK